MLNTVYTIAMIIAQIVFEFNTSLPYFSLNNLPAMEEAASKLLRKHLNTMYGSRKAFIESETNQKLRAGTRSKLQATSYAYQLGYKYIKQIFLTWLPVWEITLTSVVSSQKKHGKNFDDQLKNNVTTRKLFEQWFRYQC